MLNEAKKSERERLCIQPYERKSIKLLYIRSTRAPVHTHTHTHTPVLIQHCILPFCQLDTSDQPAAAPDGQPATGQHGSTRLFSHPLPSSQRIGQHVPTPCETMSTHTTFIGQTDYAKITHYSTCSTYDNGYLIGIFDQVKYQVWPDKFIINGKGH